MIDCKTLVDTLRFNALERWDLPIDLDSRPDPMPASLANDEEWQAADAIGSMQARIEQLEADLAPDVIWDDAIEACAGLVRSNLFLPSAHREAIAMALISTAKGKRASFHPPQNERLIEGENQ